MGARRRRRRCAQEAVKEDPEFALAHYQLACIRPVDHDRCQPERQRTPATQATRGRREHAPAGSRRRSGSSSGAGAPTSTAADEARGSCRPGRAAYPLDKDVAALQAGDILAHWEPAAGPRSRGLSNSTRALDPSTVAGRRYAHLGAVRVRSSARIRPDSPKLARAKTRPASVSVGLLCAGQEEESLEAYQEANRQWVAAGKREWPNWRRSVPRMVRPRCGGRGVDAGGPREEPGYLETRFGRPPRREHESLVQPGATGACRRGPPGACRRWVPGAREDVERLPVRHARAAHCLDRGTGGQSPGAGGAHAPVSGCRIPGQRPRGARHPCGNG